MIKKIKHIWSNVIGNINLQFEDLGTSNTVPFVFKELELNYYGLEQIFLTKEDTVIDVGANVGMFSIYVKKKFGCKVIAFEPVPMNFKQFKRNIILNGLSLDDFELHNTAVTDVEGGVIKIGTPLDNTGASSIFNENNSSTCKTETLEKYITTDCKYLKMDCEGSEFSIIPTILNKINQFSYIGIEYHKFNDNQNPKALHRTLRMNFNGEIFHGDVQYC